MNMKSSNLCLLFLSLLFTLIHVSLGEDAPIVTLSFGGKVKGLLAPIPNDPQGTKTYLYRAIKYAKAARFGKPEMVTWSSDVTYDATGDGDSCYQFLEIGGTQNYIKSENEDCLYLNIWKPITESNEPLSVMVWIHGGGFQLGSMSWPLYDGSMLASQGNVIIVTINYRLGVLGFLYGGTDDAPGNQGFYDQIAALKWVKENIQHFGGNPNQITIFGESAGSFSVAALVVSPLSQGLFQRAILQSGSIAPSPRYCDLDCTMKKTKIFAEKLGCNQNDNEEMVKCLKEKDVKDIVLHGKCEMREMFTSAIGPFHGDAVLPYDSLSFKRQLEDVDIMYGLTADEGSMFIPYHVPELADDGSKFTMEQVKNVLKELNREFNVKNDELIDIYTKDLDINNLNQVRKTVGDYFGDMFITCPTLLFAREVAKNSKTSSFYAYRFDRRSFASEMMNCTEWMGVCHASDIIYTFGNANMVYFPQDKKVSDNMIKAWTNFAKFGQPKSFGSVEWSKAFDDDDTDKKKSINAILIDIDEKIQMIKSPFKDICEKHFLKLYHQTQQKHLAKQEL